MLLTGVEATTADSAKVKTILKRATDKEQDFRVAEHLNMYLLLLEMGGSSRTGKRSEWSEWICPGGLIASLPCNSTYMQLGTVE